MSTYKSGVLKQLVKVVPGAQDQVATQELLGQLHVGDLAHQ